ncbi:MAG: HAMP domain-containing histidine kinase [Clostridiales bacterium]|nr:HAMP domain-containing histidine kinase [Clostridiales bacterium]
MKKLTHSFSAKVGAVIILILLGVFAILNIAGIYYGEYSMMYYGIDNYYETDIFRDTARNSVDFIIHHYVDTDEEFFEKKYSRENSNLRFTIAKEETPDIVEYSNYNINNVDNKDESMVYVGSYHVYNYITTIRVANPITAKDEFYLDYQLFNFIYPLRHVFILFFALSVILIILDLIFLFKSAGHRGDTDEIYLNSFDKIPFDILILLEIIIFAIAFNWIEYNYYSYSRNLDIIISISKLLSLGVIGLFSALSFAVRIKKGILIKQLFTISVIKFVIRHLKKTMTLTKSFFRMLPQIWQAALITLAIQFINLVLLISIMSYYGEFYLLLWIAFNILVFMGICFGVNQMSKLKTFAKMMANGDFESKLNTEKMYFYFKDHANNLNEISSGMNIAVEERMKSERLKTELITNVSHDIKTPLTSIINYVGLMKEDVNNKDMEKYLEIVDKQSIRLKKLLDDLVEASKASTGNITIDNAPCELNVLLGQVAGEYKEKLEDRGLELILSAPDEPLVILGDGRHLWRIFDNLLNNICKYAHEKTRVYLTLEKQENRVLIIFRNISKYPLNITSEELVERFVRGDESIYTEGSGLGLSIAKSLTELQKGSLDIVIDGDLFKVILTFDSYKREEITSFNNNFVG